MNPFVKAITEIVNKHYYNYEIKSGSKAKFFSVVSLIKKYSKQLISAAIASPCEYQVISNIKYPDGEYSEVLNITCSVENVQLHQYFTPDRYTYVVRLFKDSRPYSYLNAYKDWCTLQIYIQHAHSGSVYHTVTFEANPNFRKYDTPPYKILDEMLKDIFNSFTDEEKCYLYLADSDIKNFFKFEIDENREGKL